ncbi:MAG: tetratricopeptide repeat protein, partial [Bacteroidaceae bacterium]
REAISGYNDFEHLSGSNVTANFYYEREQMEVKCRMYAQALNDIEKAIKLAPREPVLHAEAASLNYRVGQNEQAISYAQRAITLSEDFADAHRILGVCLLEKGDKTEAHKHLLRAKELGDNLVDNILKKAE